MELNPSLAAFILFRTLEAVAAGLWLWAWYAFSVLHPGGTELFDFPADEMAVALVATVLLFVTFVLRLALSLSSAVAKWEAGVLFVMAFAFPCSCGLFCLKIQFWRP